MREEKCNGWANYETWIVNEWMGDDIIDIAIDNRTDTYSLSKIIKERIQEDMPFLVIQREGMYQDLLQGALGEVDCYELAQWANEAIKEEAEEEEEEEE